MYPNIAGVISVNRMAAAGRRHPRINEVFLPFSGSICPYVDNTDVGPSPFEELVAHATGAGKSPVECDDLRSNTDSVRGCQAFVVDALEGHCCI
ncbi:hypothetical protein AB0G04_19385 [Actinoplanes sp. NPDC023801]|uniref:hypothetical protein n=1 Tax=Actinoplanes sp. NPDC023801 TaxID=3154595 RepID=UPI0033FC6FFA